LNDSGETNLSSGRWPARFRTSPIRVNQPLRQGWFRSKRSQRRAILVFSFSDNEESNDQVEGFDTSPAVHFCVGRVGIDCNRYYQLGAREIALSYLLARACVLSILDLDRDFGSGRGIHSGKKIGKLSDWFWMFGKCVNQELAANY